MKSMLLWILLITFAAGVGGTGLGGAVGACIRRDSKRIVSLFLSFAAGVMLSVVCFDLVISSLFPDGNALPGGLPLTILGIVLGYCVVGILNHLIDRHTNSELEHIDINHPKTADEPGELIHCDHLEKHIEDNSHLCAAGFIMAAAIALHNLPEGMVIGAAYTGDAMGELWTGSGFIMAVVLGLHNIPEGMAIGVPLIASGMNKSKAIIITALSGLPTVLGALLGYWLGSMSPLMNSLALSFASGAMLYVVFGELLPESILMWRSKLPAVTATAGMILGLIIIYA